MSQQIQHVGDQAGLAASPDSPASGPALRLYNTLTSQVETLAPSDGRALRMYACGPTVYDYGHIGNFRTFLQVDVLRRFLRLLGLDVRHVMNITDVDDKIIRNASAANLPIADYTRKYEEAFFQDLDALQVEHPEVVARATEHIPAMVSLIERLAADDIAYRADDGSWYFRIARFPEYGKLSKKDFAGITDGARVDVDEYEKDAARDFALWKAPKPGEHKWETPLGPGRPGWHIECSAMAMEYLGDAFDLHAGGEDLMFPHHENEIAQSESASHKTFARHWFHVRFLLVEGRKMSKSEGNFYTLRDLLLRGYKPSAIRMLLISVPYRQQLNFTFEGLAAETVAVERLRNFRDRILTTKWPERPSLDGNSAPTEVSEYARATRDRFVAALADDLNTAEAKAAIFEMVRFVNARADAGGFYESDKAEVLSTLHQFDRIFAVLDDHDPEWTTFALAWAKREGRLGEAAPEVLATQGITDEQIQALVDERTQAKRTRNFARADQIRNDLAAKGVLIEDSKDGVRWKRK
ncbi:MAG TPA: cysteine--tRNA ligase [Acidobacteriaceae bacterium]|jgi:cysteinyl-tRNA synthetase|nr:cysteine--tRNA ligase [Acidobacteriaceae bacterium]